jgi:transcriptional regulator with XRE-family HTH domain
MATANRTEQKFNVELLQHDLDARGWLPADLARASGISRETVSNVLRGERMNPRTWLRFAIALGHDLRRYMRKVA